MHAERRRGKPRTRLLYWFRTPPSVKVGRAALDEEAIRRLEELNPDVEFDWTRILKGDQKPAAEQPWPSAPRREPRTGRGRRAPFPGTSAERVPEVLEQHEPGGPADDRPGPAAGTSGAPEPAAGVAEASALAQEESAAPTAAHARLGAEGVVRLRARHAEILTRITERVQDPLRRDELKAQAERLNPDGWVTDDEVRAGLEEYEAVSGALRAVLGGGRRRKRRRGRDGGRPQPGGPDPGRAAGPPEDFVPTKTGDPGEPPDGGDADDL